MASSFGSASGALFNQGVANGMQARRQRDARKEFERTQGQRDAETAIDLRRKEALARDLEMGIEVKKGEAARWVEAEKAFENYTGALDQIDWGSPDAAKSYATVTRQYLPSILKHESTARKWEALDGVTKRAQTFTLQKLDEANMIAAVREAADAGIVDIPRDPATGAPDRAALQALLDENRQKRDEAAERLRGIAHPGTTGRTAAAPAARKVTMSPGLKAKMDAEAKSLDRVNEALANPKLTPEGKTGLLAEKGRILKNIDRLDRIAETATEIPVDPESGGGEMQMPAAPARGGPQAPAAPEAPGKEPLDGNGVFEMDGYQIKLLPIE